MDVRSVYCFCVRNCLCVFFFFKQKTAYEMRISDWSSDVCSSDLWRIEGGSFYARNCMGFAYARAERWAPAIVAFEQGADEAERNGEMAQSARLWAQAGNAALAGGDAAKARDDFDAALARGLPDGMAKGEEIGRAPGRERGCQYV